MIYVKLNGFKPTVDLIRTVKNTVTPHVNFEEGGYVSTYTDGSAPIKLETVKPGDKRRFINAYVSNPEYWEVEHISGSGSNSITVITGETMAKIYDAAVLQTKTVPAGVGVSTGIAVQEVVHIKSDFASVSDEIAKATVIAEAVAKGIVVDDPVKPIEEVRLRSW